MNLVLIGYRGTGKSAVGEILSAELGWPVIGFDRFIVERAGKSIPEIVEESGWEAFRDLESEVTRECSEKDHHILDTGGGCILREQNVAALKARGVLFCLKASIPVIAQRIGGDDQRPSLTGEKSFVDEIAEVLQQREPIYAASADHMIDTDAISPQQAAERILERFPRNA